MNRNYLIVPDGASYMIRIDGDFPCNYCEDIVHAASYSERTGEASWRCSNNHDTTEIIGVREI